MLMGESVTLWRVNLRQPSLLVEPTHLEGQPGHLNTPGELSFLFLTYISDPLTGAKTQS